MNESDEHVTAIKYELFDSHVKQLRVETNRKKRWRCKHKSLYENKK